MRGRGREVALRCLALPALLASTQACGGGALPAREPPPAHWWVVESARIEDAEAAWPLVHDLAVPSTAWRFAASEVSAVRPGYIVDRVALIVRRDGADRWQVRSGPGADRTDVCNLQRAGRHLTLRCPDADATVTFREAVPEESLSAEHALAMHGSAEAACAHASRCAGEALHAFPYLASYAPHGPVDLRVCEGALLVFARQFRLTGRSVPVACGP